AQSGARARQSSNEGERDEAGGNGPQEEARAPVGIRNGHGAARLQVVVLRGHDRDHLRGEGTRGLRNLLPARSTCSIRSIRSIRSLAVHSCSLLGENATRCRTPDRNPLYALVKRSASEVISCRVVAL